MTVGRRLLPFVIGHRGAPRRAAENTLAAMEAAIDLGADGVEFDVRRTGDGVCVVHHDMETASGLVIGGTARSDLPVSIPGLDEVLDLVSGCAFVNVEIKDHPSEVGVEAATRTAEAVARRVARRAAAGHLMVSSFAPSSLVTVREVSPEVDVGVLTDRGRADTAIDTASEIGARAIHPADADVTPALISAAHADGLLAVTWTVNDPERALELAGWGIDGIITDVPDVLRAALG